jgi:hypothetical protein
MDTTSAPERLFTGWYTSIGDGRSHAVTDAAFTESVRQQRGQIPTVCGLIICAAAAAAPCGPACPRCDGVVRASVPRQTDATGRLRRRFGWRRQLSSHRTPGAST